MQNEFQERGPKENLTILQETTLTKLQKNISSNSNLSSTDSSPRNKNSTFPKVKTFTVLHKSFSDINSINSESISEKKKIRTDNFGTKIKKKGKQKIIFADELLFFKASEKDEKIKLKANKSMKRSNSFQKKRNIKDEFLKRNKRSNSFDINDISNRCLNRYFYNNYNYKIKQKKFINVDIIDFESTKKENKLNTYFVKRNLDLSNEDNVSCSCYCSIY